MSENIRIQLHQYLDQVDEGYLNVLKVLLEDRLRNQENDRLFFTQEELDELERRDNAIASGQAKTDTMANAMNRIYAKIDELNKNG
jgi:hypothetical protein